MNFNIFNYLKEIKSIKFNEIVMDEITKEDLFDFIIW